MTHVGQPTTASTRARVTTSTSFVEWSAVFAGAMLAAALSFVLLTFGAAIGLSATSPWPNSGAPASVIASLAIFWVMAQQIGTFMAGGYAAGRIRSRWDEATQDEVEFRDGLHGGLVWAVGMVIGAALLMATAGAATRTGAEVIGVSAASTTDPMDVLLDIMLRPATPAASPATPSRPATPAATAGDDSRAVISRILASSVASGSMSNENRAHLAQLVVQRAGVPQPDAEKRVNDAFNAVRQTADKARRAAVLTGFTTAASLIVSFGAAWWAAWKGGQHRDNAVPAKFEFGHRRRTGGPLP